MKYVYAGILFALVLLSWRFARSSGFIYESDHAGRLLYRNELLSSGSNDNLHVESGVVLFALPLVLRVALWRRKVGWADWVIFLAAWLYQGFLLISLDAGSVGQTIVLSKNMVLMLWLICYLVALPVFVQTSRTQRGHILAA